MNAPERPAELHCTGLRGTAPLSSGPVVCVSHGFQTNYERGFCNALAHNHVDVTLITSDRNLPEELHAAVNQVNLRGSQEEGRPKWQKALNLLRYHALLLWYVVGRRQDVVHVIGLITPLLWRGLIEGLWFRWVARRYVLTVHDLLPHERHDRVTKWLCRQCYRLPHVLVVHTERMANRLRSEFGIGAGRVVVMEHGIEVIAELESSKTAMPQTIVPTLLAFGGVSSRKGFDLLLDALQQVNFEFRLIIAGQCVDRDYHLQIDQLLQSHPRRVWIAWRDKFLPEEEMEALFGCCDLVVLPYRYIDQSGVLFQALRFGVPVVATRVGDFDRYVNDTVGLITEPNDIHALARALDSWYARRDSYKRSAIRKFGLRFDWKSTVLSLSSAYR